MNDPTRTIVEINGVKLDVDLRTAIRVDTMRIGDRVRVLSKRHYGGVQLCPGVVVGFEPFKSLPTIQVAYIDSGSLQVVPFNAESKDIEIVPALDDTLMLEREHVVDLMTREIARKEGELADAKAKLAYFERMFGRWFESEQAADPLAREVQA